jgi:hypothetical protein
MARLARVLPALGGCILIATGWYLKEADKYLCENSETCNAGPIVWVLIGIGVVSLTASVVWHLLRDQ